MNNSKKIALAVAMLCSAGTTLAQEINPSWYIQPNVASVEIDRELTDEREVGGGIKFGKPLSHSWDVQFLASYVKSDKRGFNYKQYLLGADALYMLSRKKFRPFLLFGIGVQRDDIEGPLGNSGNANSPYVTAGLGFQYQFNPRWSMQADYRSVRGYIDEDRVRITRTNNKYLTIGFNYAFSLPPAPYVPPPPPEPAPEPAPPPPPPPPPPPAKFEKITMKAVELFPFNSAKLSMPQPALDDIAAALIADPSITDVDITGYTDRLGAAKYNLKLSQRRADAVREYLVSKGVEGKRLKAYGKGEENPLVECTNKKRADLIKCLEPNRRVEVEQITIERRVE